MRVMKHYPLPEKYRFNKSQNSGLFYENRKDRFHCGVDVYAPRKTPVYAVDDGVIISTSTFTNPDQNEYWNVTFEIVLFDGKKFYYRYAELDEILVKKSDHITAGQKIGLVGQVLNPLKIKENHPEYIKQLIKNNKVSMLHFEMYTCNPINSDHYQGGNWFSGGKPRGLIDPTKHLESL